MYCYIYLWIPIRYSFQSTLSFVGSSWCAMALWTWPVPFKPFWKHPTGGRDSGFIIGKHPVHPVISIGFVIVRRYNWTAFQSGLTSHMIVQSVLWLFFFPQDIITVRCLPFVWRSCSSPAGTMHWQPSSSLVDSTNTSNIRGQCYYPTD